MSESATAKNLERIQLAVVQHNGNCGAAILEIRMAPFEVERLGFEDFRGIPIVGDESMGTGHLRIVCEGDHTESRPVVAKGLALNAPVEMPETVSA